MTRSEIDAIIDNAMAFMSRHRFALPPFAFWSPAQWASKGREADEIRDCMLGWDITDFGLGDFANKGLFLFTIRNGDPANLKSGKGKLYAEKLLIAGVEQITPFHFHWLKTEDIINRGGGKLAVQVYNATPDEGLADTDVVVNTDGWVRTVAAGSVIVLSPGESITLLPYCYHSFWGLEETVLVGEVSTVNDDNTDNRFYEPIGRFPEIEEDEAPLYLLVNDYDRYYKPA